MWRSKTGGSGAEFRIGILVDTYREGTAERISHDGTVHCVPRTGTEARKSARGSRGKIRARRVRIRERKNDKDECGQFDDSV